MRLIAVLLLFSGLCGAEKVDLLVQGAVDSELQLLAALRNKKEIAIAAWTFWTGRIGAKSVVVSRTEMGPINAAAATALGIEKFHPAAIVNQGTAGAHNPQLMLWDIVVGERTTDYGAFKSAHRDQPRSRHAESINSVTQQCGSIHHEGCSRRSAGDCLSSRYCRMSTNCSTTGYE